VRVLAISELYRPFVGGIEVLLDQLLPALMRRGHEIEVMTSHGPMSNVDEEWIEDVHVRRYPFRAVLEQRDAEGILLLRRRLARRLREYDPEIIHLNGTSATLLLFLPLLAQGRAAVLLQLHQQLFASEETPDSLTMHLLHRADWVVSVSAAALQQASRMVPEIAARSSTIRNAISPPDRDPSPLPFEPPTLLCLGRLTLQKGFDIALRAFASIAERFPAVRVIVAGDGDERANLEALAQSLGIAERCDFRGWVAPGATAGVIDEATVVILSSRWEGLPLVAVEAAWMARPAIATHVGGMAEVVRDQETGLLVEPDNVGDLVAAMTRLLERPELARQMGAAARAWVSSEFGWDRCVAAYDALYRQLGAAQRREPCNT
jgi:glycosyltransferase involved in cell wall biosynthesis